MVKKFTIRFYHSEKLFHKLHKYAKEMNLSTNKFVLGILNKQIEEYEMGNKEEFAKDFKKQHYLFVVFIWNMTMTILSILGVFICFVTALISKDFLPLQICFISFFGFVGLSLIYNKIVYPENVPYPIKLFKKYGVTFIHAEETENLTEHKYTEDIVLYKPISTKETISINKIPHNNIRLGKLKDFGVYFLIDEKDYEIFKDVNKKVLEFYCPYQSSNV